MEEPKYDALLVLGAVMEWSEKKGKWEFPTIIQGYPGKLVMGKARALAASEVQDEAPVILVTGGSDKNPRTGEIESRSIELSKLMTERYKIPKEKVIPMGKIGASHTQGNIENLIQYIEEYPDILKTRVIGIVSPRFQEERTKMLFDKKPYFAEHGIKLDWIIVEDILEKRDPRFKKWADAVYATPEAEINRQMEKKGIEDLRSGQYKPKT
ncbi:hypothetical protein A2W57_00895 [Candidatus Giovannonibacteria bacterium RIFCSPHIGHO2_02_43_16]|uniref:Uncharacterized protein n=1 Tax=Candidatus Giovannonibacteria bacterium RIFCSPHIGHO2_02_43_16 TaxID=1798331 RepID=A0A1F5WCX5_9BACT|nr:MAG: hypothetical protein A2W57_00895 [Candidatus Giovannonibacteria bacterium RIFCSPHIGHO2_02_43_16]